MKKNNSTLLLINVFLFIFIGFLFVIESDVSCAYEFSLSQRSASGLYYSCFLNENNSLLCKISPREIYNSSYNSEIFLQHPWRQIAGGYHYFQLLSLDGKPMDEHGNLYWGGRFSGPLSEAEAYNRFRQLNQYGITSLAAGGRYLCALSTNGSISCFASDEPLIANVPTNLGVVRELAGGWSFICAIQLDGMIRCWGDNKYGQLNVPTDMGPVQQLALGEAHGCALSTSGQIQCWGTNVFDGLTTPPNLQHQQIQKITAGGGHTCALNKAGDILCWGRNSDGESSVPQNQATWVDVTAGPYHTCARDKADQISCWGGAGFEDLQTHRHDLKNIKAVGLGLFVSCLVNHSDKIQCSRHLLDNELKYPTPQYLKSTQEIKAFLHVACAIFDEGKIHCWPLMFPYEGSENIQNIPKIYGARNLAVGAYHACVIDGANKVICWGGGANGQSQAPANLKSVTQVVAGDSHSCALETSGKVTCWGRNQWGQTSVPRGLKAKSIAAGSWFTCAIDHSRKLRCWGLPLQNSIDTIGNKNDWNQIVAGNYHVCALNQSGQAGCKGSNERGESIVPVNLKQIVKLEAGGSATCAFDRDRKITCWGYVN